MRHRETYHAISALGTYLDIMERQVPIVQARELAMIEAAYSPAKDEDDASIRYQEINYVEQLFQEDFFPAMRYSFVVFLHTVFETHLRGFCCVVQRQRKFPIDLTDLHGPPIDQARTYLRKLLGVSVAEFPQWMHLRRFQLVRNCIVHNNGYLNPQNSKHEEIRNFATGTDGISITGADRISISKSFCELHLANIAAFFDRLFDSSDLNL